jgi:hypothetical protein
MDLSSSDTLELQERCEHLIKEYTKIANELAPLLEKFGRTRKELQIIMVELQKRGVKVEGNES